jgi:hypothetical protein
MQCITRHRAQHRNVALWCHTSDAIPALAMAMRTLGTRHRLETGKVVCVRACAGLGDLRQSPATHQHPHANRLPCAQRRTS